MESNNYSHSIGGCYTQMSKAHEVDVLIETARRCGIVAGPELFHYIFDRVYPNAVQGAGNIMGLVKDFVADLMKDGMYGSTHDDGGLGKDDVQPSEM